MNLHKTVLCWLLVLQVTVVRAQESVDYRNVPSIKDPSIAALGQFGAIPAIPFNGTVQIPVPVTIFECGDIQFPIRLQYNSGGNQVDNHPGWVGLGWALEGNYSITRQINGSADEFGYLNKKNKLNGLFWASTDNLNNIIDWFDLSPDEFSVSINGFSGSFFMADDGRFKVKSKDARSIRVEYTLDSGYYSRYPIFSSFTITTDEGFKYIFGGNVTETTIPALIYVPPTSNPTYYHDHPPGAGITTNAWLLTDIISPSGFTAHFTYSNDIANISQKSYTHIANFQVGSSNEHTGLLNQTSKNLTYVRYLEKIEGSNGLAISFKRSLSNELPFVQQYSDQTTFTAYQFNNVTNTTSQYYKLDSIIKKYDKQTLNQYAFSYIENSNERLKLKELRIFGSDTASFYNYSFNYNLNKLPAYNLGKVDHYGFYNGRTVYNSSAGPLSDSGDAYFLTRETDTTYAKYEVLQRIYYPTKGYTDFIYEPNTYSKYVVQYPTMGVTATGVNKYTSGIRIRKVCTYDGMTNNPIIKEYFYSKDYLTGGTVSSGVLSGIPRYYEQGSGYNSANQLCSFYRLNSNSFYADNLTNGKFVTYSEVTEKNNNEGYKVYTYTNQDNGYMDRPAANFTTILGSIPTNLFVNKCFGKMELERGLLLTEKTFTAAKVLQQVITNGYNDDPSRFINYTVKGVRVDNDSYEVGGCKIAYETYVYNPFLKSKVIEEYDSTGTSRKTISTFSYDPNNRLLTAKTYSDTLGVFRTNYLYRPAYFTGSLDPTGIYQKMVDSNRLNLVVKDATLGRLGLTYTTYLDYYQPFPGRFVPKQIANQVKNSADTQIYQITAHDVKGNMLEANKKSDRKEVYFWGYKGQYPVAVCIGTDYNTAKQYINQAVLDTTTNDAALRIELNKLRTNLPNAFVKTYTYKPIVGISSETDERGITTYFEYNTFNQLWLKRDKDLKITQQYCYSFDGQLINCDGSTVFYYNGAKSYVFTRNCPENNIAGTYTYTVAASKYVSTISQADANSKAQNEIDTYGQQYADAYGTCTPNCIATGCSGTDKKCINNICETGSMVYTSTVKNGALWTCTYHYLWSDGSVSGNYTHTSPTPCQ